MAPTGAGVNVILIDLSRDPNDCEDTMNTHYAEIHAHDRRADLLRDARGGQLLAAANAANRDATNHRNGVVETHQPRFARRLVAAFAAVFASIR